MADRYDDSWYVLFVKTGQEDNVKQRLSFRFREEKLKMFVPKRKLRERKNGIWEEKLRTLFPGYILINGKLGVSDYYLLKGVPGIIRLLKDGCIPLEVDRGEMSIIEKLIRKSEIIENSKAVVNGSRITITDGPLLGLDGLVETVDKRKGRAKVRINFVGEPRLVDLGISLIKTS